MGHFPPYRVNGFLAECENVIDFAQSLHVMTHEMNS